MLVEGAIGSLTPLGSLLIDGAGDVRFEQTVHISGDVVIEASGVVEFKGLLTIDGGSLRIVGASQVIFGDVIIAGGDVTIEAGALQLVGRLQGSAGATLHLAPEVTGGAITVGAGDGVNDGLVLNAAALAQISGFGRVDIGSAGGGAVSVDAATLASLNTGTVQISGSQIDIAGSASFVSATDLVFDSAGALLMAANAVLASGGGDITLQAVGDLAIGLLDARGAGGVGGAGGAGGVILVSEAGSITDAARDHALNVNAEWLVMRGNGPALGPGQSSTLDAIDVLAQRLDIDDQRGLVLRDGGADGRVRFNLLVGDTLYQQLEAEGQPARGASAPMPGAGVAAGGAAQALAGWLGALRPLSGLRGHAPAAMAFGGTSLDGALGTASAAANYLAVLNADLPVLALTVTAHSTLPADDGSLQFSSDELMSEQAWGLAERLESAWVLGSASRQPAATGLQSLGSERFDRFDYWDESLAL